MIDQYPGDRSYLYGNYHASGGCTISGTPTFSGSFMDPFSPDNTISLNAGDSMWLVNGQSYQYFGYGDPSDSTGWFQYNIIRAYWVFELSEGSPLVPHFRLQFGMQNAAFACATLRCAARLTDENPRPA